MIARPLIVVVVVVIPFSAAAQAAEPSSPGWLTVLIWALTALAPVVAGLLARYLHRLTEAAAERTGIDALAQLDEQLLAVVVDVASRTRGELTSQAAAAAKRDATTTARHLVTPARLRQLFGSQPIAGLEQRIELALARAKAAGMVARRQAASAE